ncbi:ceramide glucosyltransferase [Salipiger sp. P9]|uniref:ceramide glucosyltransferase n=1 Tax=Salipiger pentaromativorans TaxID=2943193 RepID=UPI002158819B|nr:ceramide glucosyltransferase [Salipiger pentaromativorans]MCR8547837.1 ceramide glucosyltransferase [Salipiger pentaromativorans]
MIIPVLVSLVAITLGAHLLTAWLTARRYRTAPEAPRDDTTLPYISLIRPVCGLDTFDAETLASSFTQDYPRYEVIFCAPSETDPAVALLRDLIAAHPEVEASLLCGETAISRNPKLNNLYKGYGEARSEWVAMTDSNLLLPPDYLRRLVATWQAGTGLVTSPPAGIRPGNFWGAVECAFLNSSQGRWQLAADSLGFGFAQGKTLYWNRKVLDAGGGLAALGRNLAEDVASTKLVREQGLRVRLTPKLFAQPIGARKARAVWDRQLRWSRVRRDGFPLIFAAEIAQGPLVPLGALTALALLGAAPAAALLALPPVWYGAELALARRAGWPAAPRDAAAMLMRDVLLPALWVATWTGRGFTWRGTEMAPAESAGPAE